MTQPKSERMELSLEALEAILEQARSQPLSEAHYQQLKGVLNTLARLTQELEKKRTSIQRLRNLLFGPQTEKTATVLNKKKRRKENDASQAGASGQGKKKKRKGHGRNGAEAYTGAQRVAVAHESLKPGDACPQRGDCLR